MQNLPTSQVTKQDSKSAYLSTYGDEFLSRAREAVTSHLAKATAIVSIETQEDYDNAIALIKAAKASFKELDAERKDKQKQVDDERKKLISGLKKLSTDGGSQFTRLNNLCSEFADKLKAEAEAKAKAIEEKANQKREEIATLMQDRKALIDSIVKEIETWARYIIDYKLPDRLTGLRKMQQSQNIGEQWDKMPAGASEIFNSHCNKYADIAQTFFNQCETIEDSSDLEKDTNILIIQASVTHEQEWETLFEDDAKVETYQAEVVAQFQSQTTTEAPKGKTVTLIDFAEGTTIQQQDKAIQMMMLMVLKKKPSINPKTGELSALSKAIWKQYEQIAEPSDSIPGIEYNQKFKPSTR